MELRSLEEFDREFFAKYDSDPFLLEAACSMPTQAPRPTPLQIACRVASNAVIAVLIAGILAMAVPLLFRIQMLSVLSGSMEPDYPVGSLVWVVPTKFDKIKVSDDVTYELYPGQTPGQKVTHRVIEIDRENKMLVTQGIHDSELTEKVLYDHLVGVVRFSVKGMGNVMDQLNGPSGFYIKAMIILAMSLLALGLYYLSKREKQA
ncbi:MAG: signal peptidase I [Oscillospiraceae bacterium]|nr:signal peptidase I [Oscillospiraceae bacterium]